MLQSQTVFCNASSMQNNSWFNQPCGDKDSFCRYKQLTEELTVVWMSEGKVLLQGIKLCIPDMLQKYVVTLAHQCTNEKHKSMLKESCFFPFMDKLVDKLCKNCIAYKSVLPDQIKSSQFPMKHWEEGS